MSGWWVYLLRCRDGSLYTGITNDLEARLDRHARGVAAKYTRARRPVRLVFRERHPDRASAARREAAIKRLRRPAKDALIRAGRRAGRRLAHAPPCGR